MKNSANTFERRGGLRLRRYKTWLVWPILLVLLAVPGFGLLNQVARNSTVNAADYTVSNESEFDAALASTDTDINITLSGSFSLTSQKVISGKNVTIQSADAAHPQTLTRANWSDGSGLQDAFNIYGTLTLANVIVDGGGTGMAAQNLGNFASVSGTLNLQTGAVLQNNVRQDASAGAVFVGTSGTLNMYAGAVIQNNSTSAANGGGVDVHGGTFNMFGGEVKHNTAGNGGGVFIESSGVLTMSGGTITQNQAQYGGGIYLTAAHSGDTTSATLTNAVVSDNTASSQGGGFYGQLTSATRSATLTSTDTDWIGNSATGANGVGGAIDIIGGTANLVGGNFNNNTAVRGGVVYAGNASNPTTVVADGVTAENNSVTADGGVFAITNTNLTVKNQSSFSGNSAQHRGGVIHADNAKSATSSTTLTIDGATFTDNKVLTSDTAFGYGGALSLWNGTQTTVKDATFSCNTARSSGAMLVAGEGSTLSVDSSTFENNQAWGGYSGALGLGGGTGAVTEPITITASSFTNNSASGGGGAIGVNYAQLPLLTVDVSSTFSHNTADAFYALAPADLSLYRTQIAKADHTWSQFGGQSAQYGYNNYDIAYTAGTQQYYVQFNPNGGSAVTTQFVDTNTPVTKPTNPTRSGYRFSGWYTDQALTHPYDFTTPVAQSLTLYAKWQTAPTPTPPIVPTPPNTGQKLRFDN